MSVLRLCMMMSGTQIKSRWKFQQNLLRRVEKLYKPQRPGKLENWELTIFQIGIICCLCDVRMLVTLPRTLSASEKELSKYIINHPSTQCIRLIDCSVKMLNVWTKSNKLTNINKRALIQTQENISS